jgi:hypothetical protein
MVEVRMAQEDVLRSGELLRSPPGVESQPGRMDPEPGLVTGAGPALDPEIAESQLHGARGQISRNSQRRRGCRRVRTLSQSGSISQRAADTEERSELPSCGVKQKP